MARKRKNKGGRGGGTAPKPREAAGQAPPHPLEDLLSHLKATPVAQDERGRPCLCTHEIAEQIAASIREVGYLRPACEQHFLPYSTAKQWMELGEAALVKHFEGQALQGNDSLYAYFSATIARARSQLETTMAQQTKRLALPHRKNLKDDEGEELAQGDGHLSLSFLKAAFPDRWGQRVLNANVNADVKQKKEVDWSKFSKEDLELLTQLANKAEGE